MLFIPTEHPKFLVTSELIDPWHKDGRLAESELLGRYPRIVAYHGHHPITFELLLQHLPKTATCDNLKSLPLCDWNCPRDRSPLFRRRCMELNDT